MAPKLTNRCDKRLLRPRIGVTLMELLLALSLSVLVLGAITMAIGLHFKMLDVRRTNIEEMTAIRVITKMMTDDIRKAVTPYQPDLAGLETVFQNTQSALQSQLNAATGGAAAALTGGVVTGAGAGAGGGGGQSGGGQGGNGQGQAGGSNQNQQGGNQGGGQGGSGQAGAGGGQNAGGQAAAGTAGGQGGGGGAGATGASGAAGAAKSGASASATGAASGTAEADTESTATAAPTVQLIGSSTELRFDVSRLPRVEEFQSLVSMSPTAASALNMPSDVKTIVYYLQSDQSVSANGGEPSDLGGEPSTTGYGRGLMRAELDRAVTAYAETGGSTDSVYAAGRLLASEITGLGFEYFDGTQWLTEWDSTTSKSLPRAIRIWIEITPTYALTEQGLALSASGSMTTDDKRQDFYFVVNLPTAPLVATTTTEETTDATGTSSSTTSGATSSTTSTQGATP